MHIEDMKRWHWGLISIVIGLGLSYVWSKVELGEPLPTMGQADFERGVAIKFGEPGHVGDITLLPVTGQGNVQPVMCAQLRRGRDPGAMKFHPALFRATIPFKSMRDEKTYPTLEDYLTSAKAEVNPELGFRYAWYRETWASYALWTTASVILIGLVWPSVLSLMTGGGWGLMPVRRDEVEYDLSRFGRGSSASRDEDQERDLEELRRLDEELERRLASEGTVSDGGVCDGERSEQPVRKLDGGPLEAVEEKSREAKEYGGEFYPVEKRK